MHAIAPDSAATCDADFLLVHRNILAEVRLPRDAVPSTACITETVVYTVLTFDVFSCLRALTVQQSQVHHINRAVPRGNPLFFRRARGSCLLRLQDRIPLFPLRLKGSPSSPSMRSSTTPSGASWATDFVIVSCLHFDQGVELACSAAGRVLLASPSRASPSFASSRSAFLLYEASPHAKRRRQRIRASCGSALPSSVSTSSLQ